MGYDITPGRIAFEVFGPGVPQEVARDFNAWINKHDIERYPITDLSSALNVEPGRGVVLTIVLKLANPTEEERKEAAEQMSRARSNLARVDRLPFNGA